MINENQIAQIVKIVETILKQNDIHSLGNIVGDKTIFAKQGLFVGDFNPNYDFFINGRGCISGDLIIKGNLFYENNGKSVDSSYMDVTIKPNHSSGFRVRDDISAKGFIWDNQEEEFIIADEQFIENIKPRQNQFLHNIRFKNANFNNAYCKNILIDSSIIATNNKIILDGDLIINDNIKIKGNIYSQSDTIQIKSQLITKTTKIEGSLFVESNAEFSKQLNCYEIKTNNIDCSDITANNALFEGELSCKSNTTIGGYFISEKGGEFKAGLEVKGNLYLGKSLIFTGEDTGIAFTKLSTIDNASVNFINGKKVSNQGDVIVAQAPQELSNKTLASNLNANYFKITNVDHPIDSYDAVNKKYVDNHIIGSHILEPVRLATTKNLNAVFMASSYQLVSEDMEKLFIDNLEVNIGDRILIKNQKNIIENGIYIVISKGHKNQQWILQLADDWADIIKNRPKITPIVMCRYGEENTKKLFGINYGGTIWEIMGCDDFIKKGWTLYEEILAELKEIKKKINL